MPVRGDEPDLLVDTSVAVALVVADHEHHRATADAIADRRVGLAGHAAFETFSVVTRLLARNFPSSRFLGTTAAQELLARLAGAGIAGGAVYDALVGAAALEHRLRLATRDRRAIETYRVLGVDLEIPG